MANIIPAGGRNLSAAAIEMKLGTGFIRRERLNCELAERVPRHLVTETYNR